MYFVDSGDTYTHCPVLCIPVYRFFCAVASLANFGVRLYVSIVAGGSVTTTILPSQAVLKGRGFKPIFSDRKWRS